MHWEIQRLLEDNAEAMISALSLLNRDERRLAVKHFAERVVVAVREVDAKATEHLDRLAKSRLESIINGKA